MSREEDIETVRKNWAGRVFRCTETGEEVVIPETVMPKQFFGVGNCFIDVGDGHYSRFGGHSLEEVTDDSVMVTLRKRDAERLKSLVQNPVINTDPEFVEKETEEEATFRENIFTAVGESIND